ncbi:sugar phosphate isomerase/epimerase family protein [Granulicella arctica]|uniref:sugar phosphate isomerase/epimerase family protein n=1 Tax=Granulicella arctica TaxID=940613 RepID=UPI0021E0A79D|nr:sugar phosphate isomerase/epimerase [Granulicella arctica]
MSNPILFTRRRALSLLASGTLATLVRPEGWAQTVDLPAGIQLYMVKDDLAKDPAGTLRQLAAIGYREVETAGTGTLSAANFRKLVDAAGLTVPSAHVGFGMGDTGKLLDDAKALGATYAVSSVLPPHSVSTTEGFAPVLKLLNTMSVDDFKRVAELANTVAAQAKAAGLQYAYHNHNFEFRQLDNGQRGYDILLAATDPSLVRFEADCGWMKAAGVDPGTYFSRNPGRFAMIHVKDFKNLTHPVTSLMSEDAPVSTELGTGSIDYGTIVAAARKAGIRHFFLEQEPPFANMPAMKSAAVGYTALHKLLKA